MLGNHHVSVAVGARREGHLGPVPPSYLRAVAAAGGRSCVLFPGPRSTAASALGRADALLLTGGGHVDPALYGAERLEDDGRGDAGRDDFEVGLVHAALRRGIPVLAVCRGMQLLNVALGGTLHQRLPAAAWVDHGTSEAWSQHPVALRPESRLRSVLAAETIHSCSSHHSQALARVADGLIETAWSQDGLIEAVEHVAAEWVIGVQWHPEDTCGEDRRQQRLFDAFVAAARQRRLAA